MEGAAMSERPSGPATDLKGTATEFLRMVAAGRVREAYATFVDTGFRHHNPFFRGDAQSLMAAMGENAAANPDKVLEVLRAMQDGNLVAVHSRVTQRPGDRGAALVHIFRFEGGLIAELWDIGQPVPADSPNEHGMF
jgi:predicted SnoaL-like aldol condensation-catalyzing enzyme